MEPEKYKSMLFQYKLARFSLLLGKAYPFLGELCMRVEKYRKEHLGLAATDGLRLYLNDKHLNELPEESLNFVLLHELLHIILRHRYPKEIPLYERMYWNIGFDLTVNWLLMSMSSELKQYGLQIVPVAETVLSTDDLSKDPSSTIAKAFVEQAVSQGILSQYPPLFIEIEWKSFKSVVINDSMFVFDVLNGVDIGEAPLDAQIQELLSECAKAAGKDGLPWQLKELWSDLTMGQKLPWSLIFKHYLEGFRESEDSDFSHPDKRMLYSGLILPSESLEEGDELNNALIILDVSSSINKAELLAQLWQVKQVLNELSFRGSIISFGSSVYQEGQLTDKASLKRFIDDLKVGGGTVWSDVVSFVKKHKHHMKPIIVFTDGYFYSYDEGLSNVVFITQDDYPEALRKLGKVIRVNN